MVRKKKTSKKLYYARLKNINFIFFFTTKKAIGKVTRII